MDIPSLVLPVFAVILTGWFAGALGYLPRTLSTPLMQFAYNLAMPALVFVTIAQEPVRALLDWRFIAVFGGGSALCFGAVLLVARRRQDRGLGNSAMLAAAASMTNTGFVALPVLQALYGGDGVLPAAVATVFVAVVMFPALVVLLELDRHSRSDRIGALALARQVVVNPVVISTLLGLSWSMLGRSLPSSVAAYADLLGEALTPCALFSIGLGLSFDGLRETFRGSVLLSILKLVVMPLVVLGLSLAFGLGPFRTIAAVVCAAVPTAKTAFVLASTYRVEATVVGSTISMTTLMSVVTLLGWLYLLS